MIYFKVGADIIRPLFIYSIRVHRQIAEICSKISLSGIVLTRKRKGEEFLWILM